MAANWQAFVASAVLAAIILIVFLILTLHLKSTTIVKRLPVHVTTFACGLLAGLSLLIILPSAVELGLKQNLGVTKVLLMFFGAAIATYVVSHVLLEHEHLHDPVDDTKCTDAKCANVSHNVVPPPDEKERPFAFAGAPASSSPRPPPTKGVNVKNEDELCLPCQPIEFTPPADWATAASSSSSSMTLPAGVREGVTLCVQGFAWFVHSSIDGALIGAANTWPLLIATVLPVAICSVQDVGLLLVTAQRRSTTQTIVLACLFVMGFPAGTAVTVFSMAALDHALPLLRAAVGGIFLYMAAFELSPPHAHGRWPSFLAVSAFTLGVACAYLVDVAEDAIVASAEHGAAAGPNGTVAARIISMVVDGSSTSTASASGAAAAEQMSRHWPTAAAAGGSGVLAPPE